MRATPMIQDLVLRGRATPGEGARLLELRRDLRREQVRKDRGKTTTILLGISLFILGIFGFRRPPQL